MEEVFATAKALAASAWMSAAGGRGEFRKLGAETAFVVPNSLDRTVCAEIVDIIDKCAEDVNHDRTWRDATNSDTRIFQFEKEIAQLLDHLEIARRIRAIDQYTGRRTRSWFLMANRVLPIPGNEGSGGGLHRDSPFSNQVKCIWYLTDVNASTGPFQYIPNTHRNLIQNRHIYPLGKTRFTTAEGPLVEVHAKAGAMLVCDTKCIHGGKPIEEGARYAVTLYALPSRQSATDIFQKVGLSPRSEMAVA